MVRNVNIDKSNHGQNVRVLKFMTSINMRLLYQSKIVQQHYTTIHISIKFKPVDVKCHAHQDFRVEFNTKKPEFKANNHV